MWIALGFTTFSWWSGPLTVSKPYHWPELIYIPTATLHLSLATKQHFFSFHSRTKKIQYNTIAVSIITTLYSTVAIYTYALYYILGQEGIYIYISRLASDHYWLTYATNEKILREGFVNCFLHADSSYVLLLPLFAPCWTCIYTQGL
jgi:hypothetical protein